MTCIYSLFIITSFISFIISCKKENDKPEIVKDIDDNVYHTVTIGTQVWLVENLKTTKYNNGSSLSYVTDNTIWNNMNSAAYCWYNNDPTTYKSDYGALYNWYAAYSDKLCPTGWHVPSLEEWNTLINFLGGTGEAGVKLKEYGMEHWLTPNAGATNESGFTALPGGTRYTWSDGTSFRGITTEGNWANSTQPSGQYSTYNWVHLQYNFSSVSNYGGSNGPGQEGMSIRCVKN
jgi:uncharacterized protein (TIGR02145 family)